MRGFIFHCVLVAGILMESRCEEAFSGQLDQLRCVLKSRTSVYAVEEKALKVMLEGEQEEERRREEEKRRKKEKEKLLKKKCRMDAVLFGGMAAHSERSCAEFKNSKNKSNQY